MSVAENNFDWKPQAASAAAIDSVYSLISKKLPHAQQLEEELLQQTGTRLLDWVDHFGLTDSDLSQPLIEQLTAAGFQKESSHPNLLRTEAGMFPDVHMASDKFRIVVKVESVVDFIEANGVVGAAIHGNPLAGFRKAKVAESVDAELWIVQRHGDRGWDNPKDVADPLAVLEHGEQFRLRKRDFVDAAEGYELASRLIGYAVADLGVDRACDLFFARERHYWQARNQAARIQKGRQDSLGMGWANHDHHTYRSSREGFKLLIECFELLGFQCRERFYAGEQAGWGAQVLEQPTCGIVIFADVDLSVEEVVGDFSHDGLVSRENLGTVGLWCGLHGESFLQAGMHHLECQFDFDSSRHQLKAEGIGSMDPFTNFEFLKQCFTEPEIWDVDPNRIELLLQKKLIDSSQAEKFKTSGAVGSHLEILERNDGYKGFNQTGVSDIIKKTDPRTVMG